MNFLTLEQFSHMWELQDKLNTLTSGPNWTKKGQNWNLAINSEVMEFFDYIGWKWWKEPDKTKSPKDMQARLELVDIWHFLLSSIIENSSSGQAESAFLEIQHNIEEYFEVPAPDVRHLMELYSTRLANIRKLEYLWSVLEACDWSWEELYTTYIGKSVLNLFRQQNGYKEGTYQKIWWGQEDNFWLEHIVEDLVADFRLSPEAVMNELSLSYETYLSSNANLKD